MKPRTASQINHAMTLVEVLVVIAVLAIVTAIILPALLQKNGRRIQPINCINNLKQIGLAYRLWEGDNGDKYPMLVSVTNGGAMEMAATGNVTQTFLVMSNELGTPKILICPEDKNRRPAATGFSAIELKNKISYFIGVDVTNETNPQMLLSGDDNFAVDGIPVKSGLVQFSTSSTIAWISGRHMPYKEHFWTPTHGVFLGNIGLADGSVLQLTTSSLQQVIQQTGVATNRLAIP